MHNSEQVKKKYSVKEVRKKNKMKKKRLSADYYTI